MARRPHEGAASLQCLLRVAACLRHNKDRTQAGMREQSNTSNLFRTIYFEDICKLAFYISFMQC